MPFTAVEVSHFATASGIGAGFTDAISADMMEWKKTSLEWENEIGESNCLLWNRDGPVFRETDMKYRNITHAQFIERRNRFVAVVELDGQVETVHVKNTGRCKELLLPGSRVVLAKAENPARKTQYDLIAVYKDGLGWVNIDSQAPNQVVKEWLESSPAPFQNITLLKPEYTYGKFRVDFYLECDFRKIFIEVKGCTLEIDGIGYFPDAPTERGVRHLYELAEAAKKGYECYVAFVIAMPGVRKVLPNVKTHPQFGTALTAAMEAGVKVLYLPCHVLPDELSIADVETGC